MIHFALALIAIFIVCIFAKWAFEFVLESFDANFGCGCLSIIVVIIGVIIVLAIAC